jgi:mannose-1-phosphate guanylyltransferase
MIPALVLTAGLATRLRPLSLVRAKAALPVAGDPLIRHILRWLAASGVTDAVLNLHHLAHTITGIVGDGADGVRVRYSWEVPVLGSAGGPRRALAVLGTSPFLIANGDTLTNVDVTALVADHRQSGALVTMAVVPNAEPEKYGGVVVESDGTVTGFAKRLSRTSPFDTLRATPNNVEGSKVRSAEQTYHFVGVQVAEAGAFASLPDNVPSESVAERYPALLAARRGSVRAFVTSAEFFDIGTPGDYLGTSLLLGTRDSGFGTRIANSESRILSESRIPNPESRFVGARTRIASDARIEDSVLWDDVEVGANARIRRCIVTDGVRVPAGSSWENATIRIANGALTDEERLVGDLAVGSL